VESVIPTIQRRADGAIEGNCRAQMSADSLRLAGFGRRRAIESFFYGLQWTAGAPLSARQTAVDAGRRCLQLLTYAPPLGFRLLGYLPQSRVRAHDEAEALAAAQQALKAGVFNEVVGEALDNSTENPRVFVKCIDVNPDPLTSTLKKGS